MASQNELKREVGLFGGISVISGIMIGSGIFYIGSYVLMRCGFNLGLSLSIWVIGGLVTLLSGLCYAELGAMLPQAGGSYVYLKEAFGERIAFMSGVSGFVLSSSGSIAALGIAFAMTLTTFLGISSDYVAVIATIAILSLTFFNILGVKWGATIQNIFLIGKVIPIVLIIGFALFMGDVDINWDFAGTAELASSQGIFSLLSVIAFSTIATLWAYEGWTNLNIITEEIKQPKRNLPLAIILSVVFVTVLYSVFYISIYKIIPEGVIRSSIDGGNYYLGTAAAEAVWGNTGKTIVGLTMVIAIFGSLNGCVMVFPRKYYAMARDGIFFSSFAKVHPVYKTPVNAIVGSTIIALVMVWFKSLGDLTVLVIFSGSLFNILVFLAVPILRKKMANLERPYKVWGGLPTVYFIIIIMIGLSINTLMNDFTNSILGLAVPGVAGIIYNFVVTKKKTVLETK